MHLPFEEIIVNSLDELVKSLNDSNLLNEDYIYRGHSCASWELKSTLERVLGDNYWASSKSYEDSAFKCFKKRFHLYEKSVVSHKSDKSKFEWLSIMQHHGTPTRLLDFTFSPYVALYFAFEGMIKFPETHSAIYAINRKEIMARSLSCLKEIVDEIPEDEDEIFKKIDEAAPEILWIAKPDFLNSRMENQAGCFLFSGNIKQQIVEVLNRELYDGIKNFCFIIPCSLWREIYELINKLNINSKTIYGDLKGLSKSIIQTMQAEILINRR